MNRLIIGAAGATVLLLSACNFQFGTPPQQSAQGGGNKGGAPAAPAAPAQPQPAAGGGGAAPDATVQGQARQNFSVVNNTGHTVIRLNVSASNDNNWGPDILGRDVLANGESADVTFDRAETACLWDIRATYDDGDTTDMRQVNLCQVGTVTLTAGGE